MFVLMEYLNNSFNGTRMGHTMPGCNIDIDTLDTVLLVVYSLASVASLVVNGLVIAVFCKCKDLRSPTFCFVLNMSISDIFIPTLRLLNLIVFRSPMYHMELSDTVATVFCKGISYFGNVSVAVSIQSLVLISFHRFFAVVFPLRTRLESSRVCAQVISFVWIIAFLSRIPDVITLKILKPAGFCGSTLTRKEAIQYNSFKMVLFRLIPLILMIVLYAIITIKIRRQSVPGDISFQQEGKRRERSKRLTRISMAVITSFVFSWGVYDVIYISLLIHPKCVLVLACLAAESLPVVYSAANALIWFIFSRIYRRALLRVLCCSKVVKAQRSMNEQRETVDEQQKF